MQPSQSFHGQRVTVFGLGDTGLSLARYATRRGAIVTVADTRAQPPGLASLRAECPSAQFVPGGYTDCLTKNADSILLSPGVPVRTAEIAQAVRYGVPVMGDVELFAREVPETVDVVAITGANGKTTTTTLAGELCVSAGRNTLVAGNIGTPVLDALSTIEAGTSWPDTVVLELSSFQLETTFSLRCRSAAVLNVTEDHLDRYDSFAAYASAKAGLLTQTALQVLNADDTACRAMRRVDRPAHFFGAGVPHAEQAWGLRDGCLAHGESKLIPLAALKLVGRHNHLNVLAALALLEPLALDANAVHRTATAFTGLAHRMEWIIAIKGVDFIDDSKATNVGAVVAALEGLGRKAVLIAGGDGKGQDFSPLRAPVAAAARAVVLIGRDAEKIAAVLTGAGVPVVHCASLPQAVRTAATLAQRGDAVLLSPACASLDMFRNYVHRSEVFVQTAKELARD
jgi:UDP-N-acetylmuramoylalanine--D-glutamate ligase